MLRPSLESSALLDRGGKPTVRELLQSLVFNPSDGTIRLHGDRLVIQRAAVNHEMRRELTRLLGRDEARVFLIRLGFLSGQADARFIRSAWPNLSIGDAFTAGPRLHTFSGVVRVETVHNDFDFRKKRFSGDFLWHDSVEAADFRRQHITTSEPVCWTQLGYASGYATEFFDTLIVYKEVECAAEGHRCCRVVGKPAEVWGPQDPEVMLFRDRIARVDDAAVPARRQALARSLEAGMTTFDRLLLAPVAGQLGRLAQTALPVLICGPAGSGRFRAARHLHRAAQVAQAGLRRVAADTLTPEALADLLPESGRGRRRTAPETLVIDDIERLAPAVQQTLVRELDETLALGGLRLVALTGLPAAALVQDERLMPALRYALAVAPVELPGLADRPADRGPLAEALLPALVDRMGAAGTVLDAEARQVVAAHDWPGNLPEMRAVLMAALVEAEAGRALGAAALRRAIARIGRPAVAVPAPGGFAGWLDGALAGDGIALEEIERQIYDAAVARTGGNLSAAARLLGISRAQLSYRLGAKRDPA
jgi:hypothetical protein